MPPRKISKVRVPMREQPPEQRIRNFDEVPYGYSEEEAVAEAQRCLICKNPCCESKCPVYINIREVLAFIAEGKFKEAYMLLMRDNAIPGITGRVCPQEEQCEGACIMGRTGDAINVGKLETFAADWARRNGIIETVCIEESPRKVAIVGSGPAGISCAADLRKKGYQVTMYEALHMAGGVLQYGIPAFRLPKDIVDYELSHLEKMGVTIALNTVVGQSIPFKELRQRFDAIFLGTGAGAPRFMGIPGERINGVYSANEFLIRVNLMKAYKFPEYDTPIICGKRVGVVGAGNVAMDSARCARRLGSEEVSIIYRRTIKESPARQEEIHHAKEEGIVFSELINPVRVLSDEKGWLTGVELVKMELRDPDSSGRPRPVEVKGSNFVMELDTLILALGSLPNRMFLERAPELQVHSWGGIKVDASMMTTVPGVFAGGDSITGGATVIAALGQGRKAALSIHKYLSGEGLTGARPGERPNEHPTGAPAGATGATGAKT